MKKELVKDPVCGMEIDKHSSLVVEHMGKTYYFCSEGCKIEFEKNPMIYVSAEHTHHMHGQ